MHNGQTITDLQELVEAQLRTRAAYAASRAVADAEGDGDAEDVLTTNGIEPEDEYLRRIR